MANNEGDSLRTLLKNDLILNKKRAVETRVLKKKFNESSSNVIKKDELIDERSLSQLIYELWLIRNNKVLKWDKKLPDYGLQEVINDYLLTFGHSFVRYRLFFVHSNLITSELLSISDKDKILLISKPFVEALDLTKQEIAALCLEAFVREDIEKRSNIELSSFPKLKNDSNFALEMNKYIEAKIQKIDGVIFNYKSNFDTETRVLKSIYTGLGKDTLKIKSYRRLIEKIDQMTKSDFKYKYFTMKYPSPELKLGWLEGVNVL